MMKHQTTFDSFANSIVIVIMMIKMMTTMVLKMLKAPNTMTSFRLDLGLCINNYIHSSKAILNSINKLMKDTTERL